MFDRLRTEGRRFGHGVVWCTWVDEASAKPPRIAYAVGRPVGTAVVRNRVRRRLRSLLTDAARTQQLPGGYYLVGVRPAAAGTSWADLGGDVRATLARLREAQHRG